MRRIIERKVTVVTTTTWTISWKDDPLHPSSETGSTQDALPNTDALPIAPDTSILNESKEADSESIDPSTEPKPPAKDIHSHPSNSERK